MNIISTDQIKYHLLKICNLCRYARFLQAQSQEVLQDKQIGSAPDHRLLVGEQNLSWSPMMLCCGVQLYIAMNRPLAFWVMLTVPHSGLGSSGQWSTWTPSLLTALKVPIKYKGSLCIDKLTIIDVSTQLLILAYVTGPAKIDHLSAKNHWFLLSFLYHN